VVDVTSLGSPYLRNPPMSPDEQTRSTRLDAVFNPVWSYLSTISTPDYNPAPKTRSHFEDLDELLAAAPEVSSDRPDESDELTEQAETSEFLWPSQAASLAERPD